MPPELRNLWARLRAQGVHVSLFSREEGEGEKGVPDLLLQISMYKDLARLKPPGIVVLVTGDGALGKYVEDGFIPALQDMVDGGWGGGALLEALSQQEPAKMDPEERFIHPTGRIL